MEPQPLQQIDRTYVRHKLGRLSYFGGCDYFRLASHPRIVRAIMTGLRQYGGNVAASRLTTGNHILYARVETALCQFFGVPAALLAPNGYTTNLIAAQALAGRFTHAFIDARAHVSLRDAAQFLGCSVSEIPHRDAWALGRALKAAGRRVKPILLTDGVFSREGELAPLAQYLAILPQNGVVLLDDAHGAGVLGERGRGTVEVAGVGTERIIQTVTLSKAFGVYGGAILCSQALRSKIVAESRMFAGSTPPPLPMMTAAEEALRLLRPAGGLRPRLNRKVALVKTRLRKAGYELPDNPAPIIAITPRDARHARAIHHALLTRRIFPSFISYPGGPGSSYLRLALSSEHSREQLDQLIAALKSCHD